MSDVQVLTNRWARFVYVYIEQWGMQHEVAEIRECEQKPQDGQGEWGNCYHHTQVGWYFFHNIFISKSQMASFQRNSTSGSHPLNPKFKDIKLILCEGFEVFAFYKIRIDVNNTSLEDFKNSIPPFAKENFIKTVNYRVESLGGTTVITSELIEDTRKQGLEAKEALGKRLWSAAFQKPCEDYYNGQKHTTNEPVINITQNVFDLLNWFDNEKDTVVAYIKRTGNLQIYPITWWELILGSIAK